MVQPLDNLRETPSQTAGPYVHIGCIPTFAGNPGIYPEDLGLRAIEDGALGALPTSLDVLGITYSAPPTAATLK